MKHALTKTVRRGLPENGTVWAAIIAILLMTGTMMIPQDAEASCFYNKTDAREIIVNFYCGWFCHNDWKINAGNHKCRPGKGGYVDVFTWSSKGVCRVDVAKHGWVEVYDVLGKGVVESKDENGNTTHTCTFGWK